MATVFPTDTDFRGTFDTEDLPEGLPGVILGGKPIEFATGALESLLEGIEFGGGIGGAFADLTPTEGRTDDFRERLRRRLEGSGLSSAASAAGAQRAGNQQTLRQFEAAKPILSALESLRSRLSRTASGIDVKSSGEAFLEGFF